jgi:hypothetical protein
LIKAYENVKHGNWRKPQIPPLWDGKASERIVKILIDKLGER